jgi:hypothetical protein
VSLVDTDESALALLVKDELRGGGNSFRVRALPHGVCWK